MAAVARGSRAARSQDVRRLNLSTLLTYVHVHGPTARSRLTAALGLNRSTIGGLTAELVAAGLLCEEPGRSDRVPAGASSTGGRPSHIVMPESERVQVLAVDVGVNHLTVARIGLGGVVLSRREKAYRRGARRPRDVAAAIARGCTMLRAEIARDAVLIGVGVAVPGMVRHRDGQVRQAPNLGWRDAPVGAVLADQLGLPVAVGNDADLGIRAEHMRGAAADVDDAVYLCGHSGIGAGIIAGGRPLGGRAGYAGEVGHAVINAGGLPCHCGSRGCWETECGEERLFALARRPEGGGLAGVREVISAAEAGDKRAGVALEHVATWLGRGTANVVNALNPEVVILGGALEEVFVAAGDTVRAEYEIASLAPLAEAVRIVTPHLGPDSTLIGAAELAFDSLLSDPLLELSRRTAS
jgi:predicted NBD/HSP70 family sugar kinase